MTYANDSGFPVDTITGQSENHLVDLHPLRPITPSGRNIIPSQWSLHEGYPGSRHIDGEVTIHIDQWRVLYAPGGKYRLDTIHSHASKPSEAHHTHALLSDGQRSWCISTGEVYADEPYPSAMEQRLLNPVDVLAYNLTITGETVSNDRPVLIVSASGRVDWPEGNAVPDLASERLLLVDGERGFLHSDAALIDGDPYDVMRLVDLRLDVAIDSSAFTWAV